MNTMKSSLTSLVASAAVFLATVGACVQEEPPEVPPVGSLQADISKVDEAPDVAKTADPNGTSEYTNFANAWLRVQVLRVYATGVVLIPGIVMGLALTQDPVQDGDAWVWDLEATNWSASLRIGASLAGWDVDLHVTNQQVQDYLWIEGNFALDLSTGTWLAHDPALAAGQDAALQIDWSYTSETERSLVFTNVNQTADGYNDVLSYSVSGTAASVVFEDASEPGQVADISWDTTTGAGSIAVPGYNGGAAACWNSTFVNDTCP